MESDFSPFQNLQQPQSSFTSNVVEFIQTLVIFAAIATVIYLFIAQPHKVSGPSMYPTFQDGDYIISDKVTYDFASPKRGDVIVFKDPQDTSLDFIKRVIGLPGDTVELVNGKVYVNQQQIQESYIASTIVTTGNSFLPDNQEITVPANDYFVLGDNREVSSDSRSWGYVPKNEIIGRVILRYWPPSEFGINPGAIKPQS